MLFNLLHKYISNILWISLKFLSAYQHNWKYQGSDYLLLRNCWSHLSLCHSGGHQSVIGWLGGGGGVRRPCFRTPLYIWAQVLYRNVKDQTVPTVSTSLSLQLLVFVEGKVNRTETKHTAENQLQGWCGIYQNPQTKTRHWLKWSALMAKSTPHVQSVVLILFNVGLAQQRSGGSVISRGQRVWSHADVEIR